jgi:transposase InsO family protein
MRHPRNNPNDSVEKVVKPGSYLYYQQQKYRVVDHAPDNPLVLRIEHLETKSITDVRMEALVGTKNRPATTIFAPTLEALDEILMRQPQPQKQVTLTDLPPNMIKRARKIIATVRIAHALLVLEERNARATGAEFKIATVLSERICPKLKERAKEVEKPTDDWELLDHEISRSLYYKYLDICQRNGYQLERVAASLRRKTYNQSQLSAAQRHFADTIILNYYARDDMWVGPRALKDIACQTLERTNYLWVDPQKCVGSIPEDLVDQLLDLNVPMEAILANKENTEVLTKIDPPSKSWLSNHLRWFQAQPGSGRDVVNARYGDGTWESELAVFDSFVHRAQKPLQYVFADHWLIDCFTVDEATRKKVERLWLTALIDAFSRSIVGFALLKEHPCIESIQSCLRNGIWPKDDIKEWGVKGDWVCFGIPQMLSLDNAWAHHSQSLENLASAISMGGQYSSITLMFRPPYKARYGALIERFFGNLTSQIRASGLPGAIKSKEQKEIRNAAKEARLLHGDLYKWILSRIVEYQNSARKDLGNMSPNEKWLEGLSAGISPVPSWSREMDRLFWRRSTETRKISRQGIAVFGMHYWSHDLHGAERIGMDGRPVRYSFSYEPYDLSRIAVFRGGEWVGDAYARELLLADGTYKEISLTEKEIAKDLALDDGKAARDYLAYIDEIKDLAKIRAQEQRKAHQMQHPEKHPLPKLLPRKEQPAEGPIDQMKDIGFGSEATELLKGFAVDAIK